MEKQNIASNFIKSIQGEREGVNERRTVREHIVRSCNALTNEELPPIEYINNIGSDTHSHFKGVMVRAFSEFFDRYNLDGVCSVLDLGCGCGRLAYPMVMLLQNGTYVGVDVWKEGIDWCSHKFANEHHRARFFVVEAKNNYYYEPIDYRIDNSYALPFVDNDSVDFTFAVSLFTHLTYRDAYSYLREIRRCLKRKGAAHTTAYIVDDFFFAYRERTGKHAALREVEPGCWHAYSGQDFFGGFTMDKWKSMVADAGLRIVSYEAGKWADKPGGRNHQDAFTLIRDDWS